MLKQDLVEKIILLEWSMFDKVDNQGGRAYCQNDPGTFNIMRSSQLLAWEPPMLESYLSDLTEADCLGRNLLSEKYARMRSTPSPMNMKSSKSCWSPYPPNSKSWLRKSLKSR